MRFSVRRRKCRRRSQRVSLLAGEWGTQLGPCSFTGRLCQFYPASASALRRCEQSCMVYTGSCQPAVLGRRRFT